MLYSAGFAVRASMPCTSSAARSTNCKVSTANTGLLSRITSPHAKGSSTFLLCDKLTQFLLTSVTLPAEPCNNQLVLFEAVSFAPPCCKSRQLMIDNIAQPLADCGDCNNLFYLCWPDPWSEASRALCFCCFSLELLLAPSILTLSTL